MTSAPNHLQLLSGNKIWLFIFFLGFVIACDTFKPVQNTTPNNGGDDLEEVGGVTPNPRDANAAGNTKPSGGNTTKPTDNTKPSGGNTTKPTDNTKPSGGNTTKPTDNTKPSGGNTTKPTDNTKPSGGNTTKPTDNTKPSSGNTTKPTDNTKPSSGNTTKPTDNTKPSGSNTSTAGLKSSYKVGIVMPLFADELAAATTIPKASVSGINFYEGILLGLEQLSRENVNLDVEVYDTKRNTAIVQGLVDNFTLNKMDLIIGPATAENVTIVAEQVAKKGVPMISMNVNSDLTDNNPYFIQASPYFEAHAEAAVEYVLATYPNRKILVVVPREGEDAAKTAAYKKAKGGSKIIEVLVDKNGSAYKFALSGQLTNNDTTVILSPSSDENFVNGLLSHLSLTQKTKPTVVFGMPKWMSFTKIDLNLYEECHVHVTNATYVNDKDEDVKNFKNTFFNTYGAKPTIEAYKGYDMILHFGRMLKKYGTEFPKHLEKHPKTYLQGRYEFEKVGVTATTPPTYRYFENKFVYILRFENYTYTPMNFVDDDFTPIGND
jgi:ABC-type branched-subunit amino acid transport system substrate-binding protein